ncbi:4-alpha-L-fucosyltransferase glycosyl transferase group 56 [Sphingobacterium nematocida]|uniref:4-alpha-L-fucosyltransferase glycosyl transferase group 56 n=2 Tax=Sphingobacterium nematocida TaxID=1513896 RepID=A0A1T5D5R9_9SPHI|nr:4-alpha-L-fucosyltransferase glycosyl transferase group 56 [Sphingobacterium nematocida]
MKQFERAYPGKNCYIILLYNQKQLKYTVPNAHTYVFHIRDLNLLQQLSGIIQSNSGSRLFLHFIDDFKAALVNKLLDKFKHLRFYWIFYGGDLYEYLTRYEGYQIIDDSSFLPKTSFLNWLSKRTKYLLRFGMSQKTAKMRAFQRLDYFCFWNEYDYQLFHSKIKSAAEYKSFIYCNALGDPAHVQPQKKAVIMINHAASFSGNHHYIIHTLAKLQIPLTEYQILLPLSYGDKKFADKVKLAAEQELKTDINALTKFLPINEYQKILSEVKIAIFGMRRQEAAGNVFQLLNMGAQVFLRKDNTLLHWLKKRDFIVFCIEEDELELSRLNGLTLEQMSHNRIQYERYFNSQIYDNMMQQLIIDTRKSN